VAQSRFACRLDTLVETHGSADHKDSS